MKKLILTLSITLLYTLGYSQVGIGTTSPHTSSALDITDSARGILIPRMTMIKRNTILNPAEGLMVYQTDGEKGYWYFNGSEWKNFIIYDNIKNNSDIRRLQTQFYIKN